MRRSQRTLIVLSLVAAAYRPSAMVAAQPPTRDPSPKAHSGATPETAPAPGPPRLDFNRDIVSILSSNCFKCHGPDPDNRQAGLRLDDRNVATKPAESGAVAIVPGRPNDSELVRRIFADDPDERMPPKQSNKTLTDLQKQTLRRWIAEGAEYAPHWAFVAPRQAPLPVVKQKDWPKNAIDYFVLARLEAEGLHPSPEADRYSLVRRVFLDLIGLPPTPEEAEQFVSDAAPDAYERLVDRLLASPRYGERWARRWLDLARYADTNGYEKDRPRSIWPYRDWVIKALNADLPFDEFTIEQLAGDLLPQATIDQRIATGFHRNTMRNEEGGIDPQEFRYYSIADRVNTTGTTWLGLTIGCAQCHTHKFDPITNREYYQMMAFFNNANEPELAVPDEDVARRRKKIEGDIARLTAELPQKFPAGLPPTSKTAAPAGQPAAKADKTKLEVALSDWTARESVRAVKWTTLRPAQMSSNAPTLTLLKDDSVLASGDLTKRDTYELTFRTDLRDITAVRLEALTDDSLPRHGPGMIYYEGPFGDFFLSEIELTADGRRQKFAAALQSIAAAGLEASHSIDGDPQTGWMIGPGQGKPQYAVFRLAAPTGSASEFKIQLLFERYYAAALGRFRISVSTDPRAGNSLPLPPDVEAALTLPAKDRSQADRELLRQYYLSIAPELAAARQEIEKLRQSLPEPPTTLVMAERPAGHGRPTHRHHRGEFLQPKELVEPGTLAALPALPPGAPHNRLTLARWLVSSDNPLTSRVTVNRQWAAFFGTGIVRTTGDFGYQGDRPSHPELIDWLAVEFVKEGWSFKKLDRLIVTSATYRQASGITPELLARDPQNILLGRGPRTRLEAELVRDMALRSSGLLSEKLGGPSVFPPQPTSVTTEGAYGSLAWRTSSGEDRFRRSLYTYAKRTAPFALYNTFDAPSGEACVARREVSNTALQALALLNDTVFLEAAQALGATAAAMPAGDEVRASMLFRRCLTRPPSHEELSQLTRFVDKQRGRFANKQLDAAAVAGDVSPRGVSKSREINVIERAAWTTVARAILNLDEAITKN